MACGQVPHLSKFLSLRIYIGCAKIKERHFYVCNPWHSIFFMSYSVNVSTIFQNVLVEAVTLSLRHACRQ